MTIDFQDRRPRLPSWNPIGTILAMNEVTSRLPTKFQVSWPSGSGDEEKNIYSRWPLCRPSWISDRNDFNYFWSISHPVAPTKFQASWLFGSGGEAQNMFPRLRPRRPSGISDRNDFSFFYVCKSSRCVLPSLKSTGILVQEKKRKIYFQDGGDGGQLVFPIGTILAIFIYKSPWCFLPSFESTGPAV